MSITIEKKLENLNVVLPEPAKALASYIGAKLSGDFLFVSGQLPVIKDLEFSSFGKVGTDVTLEEAKAAARNCAINILAQAKACIKNLDAIESVIKLTAFVNSAANFYQIPEVANGASDFFQDIFGENGVHTRAAVGVYSLPLNAPVEVEAIFSIKR